MKVLRHRTSFSDLPDFAFAHATWTSVQPLRCGMHYLDEGSRDAAPVLLMHAEPSWCFLYRKMIPPLAARGHRAVAPDLIGFGCRDKPINRSDYSFERHVDWMSNLLVSWISGRSRSSVRTGAAPSGCGWLRGFPERFAAVIASKTGLPTGGGRIPFPFKIWLAFSQYVPRLPIGWLISKGTVRELNDAERKAYDAPFPNESYKAGARQFPALVPITECKQAWDVLGRFDEHFLTVFSDRNPITRGGDRASQQRIPGASRQPHVTIRGAE